MPDTTAPFAGLLVLDLPRLQVGLYTSMTLGDLAAEVTKLKRLDGSDDTPQWVILTWRKPKPTGLPDERSGFVDSR